MMPQWRCKLQGLVPAHARRSLCEQEQRCQLLVHCGRADNRRQGCPVTAEGPACRHDHRYPVPAAHRPLGRRSCERGDRGCSRPTCCTSGRLHSALAHGSARTAIAAPASGLSCATSSHSAVHPVTPCSKCHHRHLVQVRGQHERVGLCHRCQCRGSQLQRTHRRLVVVAWEVALVMMIVLTALPALPSL